MNTFVTVVYYSERIYGLIGSCDFGEGVMLELRAKLCAGATCASTQERKVLLQSHVAAHSA